MNLTLSKVLKIIVRNSSVNQFNLPSNGEFKLWILPRFEYPFNEVVFTVEPYRFIGRPILGIFQTIGIGSYNVR